MTAAIVLQEVLAMRAKHHSKGRLPEWVKKGGVIACCQAYKDHKVNWGFALQNFKALDKGEAAAALGGRPMLFLVRVWKHFQLHGNLEDEPRSGRPPNMAAEDAIRAAALLKMGKQGSMLRGGRRVPRLVYYTTVEQACHEDPELEAIRVQYNATHDQLLYHMKRHDPDLVRRTITYHPDFSAAQLTERMQLGSRLLQAMPTNPTAARAWLDRFLWGDEGAISLTSQNLEAVRVWCSKANFDVNDIVSLPRVRGQKDSKVHFFIVVSSHPAFRLTRGVVYFEFTTGTNNIKRLQNTMGQDSREAFGYMVGVAMLWNIVFP